MNHRQLSKLARGMAVSVAAAAVSPAWAGPIQIETPQRGEAVGGSNIACVAEFASQKAPITRVVFLVDGEALVQRAYKQAAPQARVAFVWDAKGVPAGPHTLTVRAFAGSRLVGEDEVPVVVAENGEDIVKPQVHLFSPGPNGVVSGRQDISIHASDNERVTMVSLFIDSQLKLLQNVPPFFYSWDTTQYPNGPHTIEVWAFDPAQNKGESRPIRVFVNNPTGRTNVKDLPDEVPATATQDTGVTKPVQTKPAQPQALPEAAPAPKPVKTARKSAPVPTVRAKVAPKLATVKSASVARKASPPVAAPAVKGLAPDERTAKAPATPSTEAKPEAVKSASPPVIPAAKAMIAKSAAPAAKSVAPVAAKAKVAANAPAAQPKAPAARTATTAASAVKPAPKTLIAQAPKPTAIESGATEPVNAKPAVAPKETPSFTGQQPAATPMPVVNPRLRTSLPASERLGASSPASTPKAVRPAVKPKALAKAPARSKPEAKPVVKPTAPVLLARAETRSNMPLGNARMEESSPAPVSPAAHRIAAARPPLRILLGQEPVEFDVQPTIEKGIAIAPLRQIIEHTGGMVMWLPATRTVQATSGPQSIEVKIGSRRAKVNAQIVLMDRPATLTSGRTMVPVRFLQTALNMKALYDPTKGLVYLFRP